MGKGSALHITPLMRACEQGHEDIMLCLLEARASPVQCDSHGWSALCHALGAGEVELARRLTDCIDKKTLKVQKDTVHKLRKEILVKCEREAGKDAMMEVQRHLEPSGFLALKEGELSMGAP